MTAVDDRPAALEGALGDPEGDGPLSWPTAVATDERGEPDRGAFEVLEQWGLPGFLVPEADGGRLRSLAEPFELFRCLARRDLRVAVGYGSTFLSAVPVWLWGDDRQRALLAGRIGAGDLAACAISERNHGSDLLRSECRALPRGGGSFAVRGEKWPIGNATRGGTVTLLARTGASAFSLLLLDKRELPADRWRCLPPAATLGLRGHDLSGLAFDDCPVPASAVLGAGGMVGTGLAQILRTLQVTRTLVAGLSLGALDTALRVATGYAAERRLYGGPIDRMPVVRDLLVRAYADLLVGECVAVPAVRAAGAAPGRLVRWSAVTKYLVPVLAEEAIAGLATVLSARAFLADDPASRLFQKVQRDHAVMSVFDGTTHVNLAALTGQPPVSRAPASEQVLTALFRVAEPAPAWRPDGAALALAADGTDEIGQGWPDAVAELEGRADGSPVWRELLEVLEVWHGVRARCARAVPPGGERHPPVRAFALARTRCLLHAAASCVHLWRHSGPADPAWLLLCLQRLLQRLDPEQDLAPAAVDWAFTALGAQHSAAELFSLRPVSLAG